MYIGKASEIATVKPQKRIRRFPNVLQMPDAYFDDRKCLLRILPVRIRYGAVRRQRIFLHLFVSFYGFPLQLGRSKTTQNTKKNTKKSLIFAYGH